MADYFMTAERFGALQRELAGLSVSIGRRILTDGHGNRYSEITMRRGAEAIATGRIYKDRDRVEFSTGDGQLIGELHQRRVPSVDELLEHWHKTSHGARGRAARPDRGRMPAYQSDVSRPEPARTYTGGMQPRSAIPGMGSAYELSVEQYQLLQERLGQDFALRREGEYPRMNFRHETLRATGDQERDRVAARAYVHYSRFGGQPTSVSLRTSEPRVIQELDRMGLRPIQEREAAGGFQIHRMGAGW